MSAEFVPGQAGWAAFREEGSRWYVLVKVSPLEGDRLRVVALEVQDIAGIGTDHLRRIPLGRIESIANLPTMRAALIKGLDRREKFPAVRNVSNADARTMAGLKDLARYPEWSEQGLPPLDQLLIAFRGLDDRAHYARIEAPGIRPYPRSFYEQVADRYQNLAAIGSRRPAEEIASASRTARGSKVPVSTVHRWVKEARRLGLLPAGQRGKIT